ncbi:MAG TPA: CARDB domain-containing protein, partial [Cryomorphaceae bacterium]|nr:CARDB domain-containing protein [Cryomorphaceae bacterium]
PPAETYTAGDEMELSPVVSNIGGAVSNVNTWYDRIFLISEESVEDTVYQEVYDYQNALSPGEFYSVPGPFTIPLDVEPGFYSIGVAADAGEQVWENESEENNIVHSDAFQIVLDSSAVPDLQPLNPGEQTWQIGDAFTLDVTIANSGTATGISTWVDEVYITSTSGNKLASFVSANSGSIPAGGNFVSQFDIVVPTGLPDNALLNIKIDTTNAVFEYNQANNLLEVPLEITSGPTPDLSPTNLVVANEVNAGQELVFAAILNNYGDANVESDLWLNRVLLSANNTPDDNDILISTEMGNPIQAGSSEVFSDSVQIPLSITGSYFLIYQMDAGDDVGEGFNEDNNFVVSEEVINVSTPAPVDFETALIDFNITDGNLDNMQFDLTNTGNNNFTGSFYNTYYLSEDPEYSSDDQLLGWNKTVDYELIQNTIAIDPGETITQYASFGYLPVIAGDYYVIQKIDALFHVYETDEANNTAVFGPVYLDNIEEIFPDITYDRQFGRNLPPNQIIGLPYQFSDYGGDYSAYPDRHNYKIDIPDGFGMLTRMWENEEANENYGISNESQPIYEMYIGEGYVPTLLNYDFIFDSPLQAEQHIVVPVDDARTDYIKTQAPYIPPHFSIDSLPVSKYKLRAEFKEFSIFEAKPNQVGNSHNATLRISGFDLVDPEGFDV